MIILICPHYKCTALTYKRNNPVCGCTCKRWCWNFTLHNSFVKILTAGVWKHSPVFKINKENLWLSVPTTSNVRISHPGSQDIQLNTHGVRRDGTKGQLLRFSHLCYTFLWGTRVCCLAKLLALNGAPVKPVNWKVQGCETHHDDWNRCHVLLPVINQFKTGQQLLPMSKGEVKH